MPTPADNFPPLIYEQPQQDSPQSQIKVCSTCQRPLSTDSANTPFIVQDGSVSSDTSIVCGPCWNRINTLRSTDQTNGYFDEVQREILRRVSSLQQGGINEANELRTLDPPPSNITIITANPTNDSCPDAEMSTESTRSSGHNPSLSPITLDPQPLRRRIVHPADFIPLLPSPSPSPHLHSQLATACTSNTSTASLATPSPHDQTSRSPRAHTTPQRDHSLISPSSPRSSKPPLRHYTANPLTDITRLRVRSQGHHCLYPGATFQGTQKSGRNSYDVTVTIVDVDFSRSHLCGYLRIRGLTEDWPELTTYFDAEIIGSRYGFLTRNWGASEQEDWVHWARFPAFRHVKNELEKPHLTMKQADRGAVFMRWKEKFLVPDHRVQDINGASFAGFYYVCVDFNPQHSGTAPSHPAQPPSLPPSLEEDDGFMALPGMMGSGPIASSPIASTTSSSMGSKPEFSPRARRESLSRGSRRMGRSSSRGAGQRAATMSGFYFHQNSEP
ncbi:hypothetical protein NLI96_g11409 [Meripilus lineatus]|uniref:Vacuolar import and degradation protein-domain-containing protein n=1 Tax=Meripilus lineatus TaxID=2056292 RepID=A0AAD5URU5_9APHY|nr:hypothetical protein NLI96_g11409 [Physisporinus lineatus]